MPRIAILHDDPSVAARASACAERLQLDVIRTQSADALSAALAKGGVDAVLLDVVGPNSGGFELIEKVCAAAPSAVVIVVTELDAKTVQSTERLIRAKKLNVSIFRSAAFGEDALRAAPAPARHERTDITVTNLQDSIEQNFLRVEYQPKVPYDTQLGGRSAVEALVRLRHPRLGDVYPDQFIRVAEKHGLIEELTDSVTRQVFADLVAWRASGLHLCAAINVSPLLLNDAAWSTRFMARCEEYGIGPDDVTLEITESSMGAENSAALDVLTRLRLKGFTLSIDDFGTGFSSLANLYKLPFGELKLDKSFVMDLAFSEEAKALVETTVAMARRIGLKVVAEGVETEAAFEQLRSFGCDYAQGYWISRPMVAARVPEFFAGWARRTASLGDRTETVVVSPTSKIGVIQALLSEIMAAASATPDSDETLVIDSSQTEAFAPAASNPVHEVVRRIPSLVMKNQPLQALAACHEARLGLESSDGAPGVAERLGQLQSILEQDLLRQTSMDLTIESGVPGAPSHVRLIGGKPAVMGRGASGGAVDIPTNCRWFSRGERNLSIHEKNGAWSVEDLGSTNGKLMNGAPLEPGASAPLPLGETDIRIGRDADSCPPVSLLLVRTQRDPGAVRAQIAVDRKHIEDAAAGIGWTSWSEESARLWIVLGASGAASIGAAPDCAIPAPQAGTPVAATLEFDGGFWLCPADGAPLTMGGCVFHRPVPLVAGAEVCAGGVRFTARTAAGEAASASSSAAPMAFSA